MLWAFNPREMAEGIKSLNLYMIVMFRFNSVGLSGRLYKLAVLLSIFSLTSGFVSLFWLSEDIPSRIERGEIVAYGSKYLVFLIPLIGIGMLLFFKVFEWIVCWYVEFMHQKFPSKHHDSKDFIQSFMAINAVLVSVVFLIIQFVYLYTAYSDRGS